MRAPTILNGNYKTFEETFVSPQKETKSDALGVLEAIRNAHSSAHGWVELEGFVEQLPNGKWQAVRHHAQYK